VEVLEREEALEDVSGKQVPEETPEERDDESEKAEEVSEADDASQKSMHESSDFLESFNQSLKLFNTRLKSAIEHADLTEANKTSDD
ncbi:hypothetical protein ACQZV8_12935, partial [Magnetococcales bacterium HHB-1]